ncbi:GNAT family N-acetyltransferase [Cellvibrio sp.]|uniref:GNAT family N-acetyltransferase n=1 Tax=Cellvibrio sp. TaxID=1965322 RepID=UPI00374E824A
MQNLVKEFAKKLARMLIGDYSAYYIYSQSTEDSSPFKLGTATTFRVGPVDEFTINSSPESLIREQVGYAGPGSHAYACFDHDRIVGVCFYWFGNRYLKRNFWPLVDGEAKLVQIISLPEMRGRGVATMLIASSCRDMMQNNGFCRTYARIWHSNMPSLRAFERAGWTRVALIIEINPLRRSRPTCIRFDSKSLK